MLRQSMVEKPSGYTCLAGAFAQVFDCPIDYIFQIVGHDGSPTVSGFHRGFHIEEMQYAGLKLGYAVVLHSVNPVYPTSTIPLPFDRFDEIMAIYRPGVARVVLPHWDHAFAVLPNGDWVNPANGFIVPSGSYEVAEYYSVHKIRLGVKPIKF